MTRLAAAVAFLFSAAVFGVLGLMVWHSIGNGTVPGAIFMGILPTLFGVFLAVGARLLWKGDPEGGEFVRGGLGLLVLLLLGGIGTSLFRLPDQLQFVLYFSAGVAVLVPVMLLIYAAELQLHRSRSDGRPSKPRRAWWR